MVLGEAACGERALLNHLQGQVVHTLDAATELGRQATRAAIADDLRQRYEIACAGIVNAVGLVGVSSGAAAGMISQATGLAKSTSVLVDAIKKDSKKEKDAVLKKR